VKPEIFSKN